MSPARSSTTAFISALKTRPEAWWQHRGAVRTLRLFHAMARRVPAYRDFLVKHRIDSDKITAPADLKHLPPTDKNSYLRAYELKDLAWDGIIAERNQVVAATSGSSGEPFYFPRSHVQDAQFAFTLDVLLRDYWAVEKRSTLFVNCFALGIWIGGMYMYQALKYVLDRNQYRLTVVNPGAYKEEAIKAIKRLGKYYDQVIIGGYAPLVKDLLDDAVRHDVDWRAFKPRFFFAAEGFSETFRDYILGKVGLDNPYVNTFNHYGTADMGTMAHETPFSIFMRRQAFAEPAIGARLLPDVTKQPTICQYLPELFYFEEVDGGLFCSSGSGLPLIRYDLKDRGGVFTWGDAERAFAAEGKNMGWLTEQAGLRFYRWNVPFVYVYERADLTVSIYSVNIYPESVRRALEKPDFQEFLTTKFSLTVGYDNEQNQVLRLYVELKNGIVAPPTLADRIQTSVVRQLNEENSEWRDFYADESIRHKILPVVELCTYEDPTYFKSGRKQRWVLR